ncbi:M23 family metallopeptidase [Nonomuraea sediminis]|uniref:M23 family metallopeptidase n=1 Tax=Nonomuraea sediminis TaxID=2835864 RepID=UPI00355684C9
MQAADPSTRTLRTHPDPHPHTISADANLHICTIHADADSQHDLIRRPDSEVVNSNSRRARPRTTARYIRQTSAVFILAITLTVLLTPPAIAHSPIRAPTRVALAPHPDPPWRWPLDGHPTVLRRFTPPPVPWLRGHRGIDLAALPGTPVYAAGPGVVTFAARLANRGVIAITHPTGLRTTYLPVKASVRQGQPVTAATPLGVIEAAPGHCPVSCLHWGLLRATRYLDPLLLLTQANIRLLPYWPTQQPLPPPSNALTPQPSPSDRTPTLSEPITQPPTAGPPPTSGGLAPPLRFDEPTALPTPTEAIPPTSGGPALPTFGAPAPPTAGKPALATFVEPTPPASDEPVLPTSGKPTPPTPGKPTLATFVEPTPPASDEPVLPTSGEPTPPALGEPVLLISDMAVTTHIHSEPVTELRPNGFIEVPNPREPALLPNIAEPVEVSRTKPRPNTAPKAPDTHLPLASALTTANAVTSLAALSALALGGAASTLRRRRRRTTQDAPKPQARG